MSRTASSGERAGAAEFNLQRSHPSGAQVLGLATIQRAPDILPNVCPSLDLLFRLCFVELLPPSKCSWGFEVRSLHAKTKEWPKWLLGNLPRQISLPMHTVGSLSSASPPQLSLSVSISIYLRSKARMRHTCVFVGSQLSSFSFCATCPSSPQPSSCTSSGHS